MSKLSSSGAFEYRCAYRYETGEVEGFVGTSLQGEAAARQDAIMQIGRKLVHINHARRYKKQEEDNYDPSRLITNVIGLTPAEKALIETDWKTNVRY
jgi:hypothetical protein